MDSSGDKQPNTLFSPAPGLSRSGSLSDRLKSSFKGGMSGLLKKSQDNARLKARLSKATPSRPSSAASAGVINDKTEDGKPVELPTKELPARKQTAETTNSSVVDPNYSPNSKAFRKCAGKQKQHVEVQAETSFFEDSSDEEEESPTVQRASSVRVGKPILVRHFSNAANAVGQSTPLRKQDDRVKTPELPVEKGSPANDDEGAEKEKDGPAAALRLLEGGNGPKPLPSPPSSATAYTSILGGDITFSPSSLASSKIQASPGTPSTASITITTPLSPLSALRSNPITPTTGLTSARLSRALSAPTPPNRNPNRRVTIRPSDLVINHNDKDHRLFRESVITTPYPGSGSDTRSKTRLSDIPDAGEVSRANSVGTDAKPHILLLSPQAIPISPFGPGDRDRFPSLTSTESLFITISLFNHPSSASTLEINTPASTTLPRSLSLRRKSRNRVSSQPPPQPDFDDAALFTLLRNHYHKSLIGLPCRWLLLPTRNLYHAACIPISPSSSSSSSSSNDAPYLDATDFIAHLRDPSLGKGKKGWLLWLRNNQQASSTAAAAAASARSDRTSSLFSSASTTHTSHTAANPNATTAAEETGTTDPQPAISPTDSETHNRTTAPGVGLGVQFKYPRMPFRRPAALAPHQTPSSSNQAGGSVIPVSPHIVLHHRLNILTVSAAGLAVLLAGVLTVVFWVLFGVPGLGAGMRTAAGLSNAGMSGGDGLREAASYGDWRVDAQMRVLTGLVLGAVVWVGGSVGLGGWVLAGWLLL